MTELRPTCHHCGKQHHSENCPAYQRSQQREQLRKQGEQARIEAAATKVWQLIMAVTLIVFIAVVAWQVRVSGDPGGAPAPGEASVAAGVQVVIRMVWACIIWGIGLVLACFGAGFLTYAAGEKFNLDSPGTAERLIYVMIFLPIGTLAGWLGYLAWP